MMFILTMGPTVYRHECVTLPLDIPLNTFPPNLPDNFPLYLGHFSRLLTRRFEN